MAEIAYDDVSHPSIHSLVTFPSDGTQKVRTRYDAAPALSGTLEQMVKNEKGEKITLQGDYLTVWQKQADGSWKVIYDGGTPDAVAR